MPSKKNVGVIGSGPVGQVLVSAFSKSNYETKIGSRSPEKLDDFIKQSGGKISSGTFEEVASFGEIIVLATHGDASESAIDLAGAGNLSGKILIDSTNPLDFSKGMPPGILPKYVEKSLGEHLQEKLPDAMVVKCFNTCPNSLMYHPKFQDTRMPICGNHTSAKNVVTEVVKEFGWAGSLDIGGIESSRWLEAIVPLWVRAASVTNEWVSLFKFVS